MHAITEFLYPAPARRTVGGIALWWEKRRPAYNLIVGASGLVSLVFVSGASLLMGGVGGGVPWQPVVAFGVMANVFYFLGPIVESLAYRIFGDDLLPVGPALFRMGLTFSVGLALLPTLMVTVLLVVKLVTSVF